VSVRGVRALCAGVTCALVLASAAPAAASWRVVPTSGSGSLSAVSCVSTSVCAAVGVRVTPGSKLPPARGVALAERWNGRNWAIQRTPTPTGSTSSELLDVSCTSRTFCIAVGWYSSRRHASNTLVERWNGSRWSIQQTPKGFLASGVSCTSKTACTAVGGGPYTDGVLVDFGSFVVVVGRWNGSRWSIQRTPRLAGAGLGDVSCASAARCVAVGDAPGLDGYGTLAERWNRTTWSIQQTPTPGSYDWLWDVSCPSATACTAVGASIVAQGTGATVPVVERWNGHRWSLQPLSATDPYGYSSSLNSVSCPTSTACTAVGGALAERWNGSRWSGQPLPGISPPSPVVDLNGVSCPSATTCIAVGSVSDNYGRRAVLAERYS